MIEHLPKKARAFDFYHAVRLIQSRHPEMPRIGASKLFRDDPVQFCQRPFTGFVPSAIDSYEKRPGGKPDRMYVFFSGLFGPNGPLPLWMTEYAREREWRYNDTTLTDFLNLFHHRFISLFWRAWASSQRTVDIDRGADGHFPKYFGSLIGLGMKSLRHRDSIQDDAKLFFTGRLIAEPRNAEGLSAILTDYFGIAANVESFIGHWLRLPEDARCRLGESPETGALGMTALAGASVWDTQLRIQIQLGPMGLSDFLRMLPSGCSFKALRDWVFLYTHREYEWDIKLVLVKDEIPGCQLGQFGQLGWSTWLKSIPADKNAEVVFNPPSVKAA